MIHIENEHIKISVKRHGAELSSIIDKRTGEELLWQGNPSYWERQSPVLFPIVGSVWKNQYIYNGNTYQMSQHGFARDMDFTLIENNDNFISFELRADEVTKKLYPADFVLEISYELKGKKVIVGWKVTKNGEEVMHFQIGAHPAFNYKNFDPNADVQAYFDLLPLDTNYRLSTITEGGCIGPDITKVIYKEHCIIPITKETFNNDALILEDSQVMSVELKDAKKNPYLKLEFDAPVLGLWSPAKDSYAPFVCIEPWFGRCDRVGYEGEFKDRDWTMHLDKKNSFSTFYSIEVL